MSELIVYGFPRSTFVNIVRLVLTHKEVQYTFHDLEPEMGKPSHLALHPFNRVPILQHGDFTVYETSAIVTYLDETFPNPSLQPKSVRDRAGMNQWISAVNSYYYPYMIYHVSHERNVFPELGIPSDEKVVAHALPKIEVGLTVAERALGWRTSIFSPAPIHLASPGCFRCPGGCLSSHKSHRNDCGSTNVALCSRIGCAVPRGARNAVGASGHLGVSAELYERGAFPVGARP